MSWKWLMPVLVLFAMFGFFGLLVCAGPTYGDLVSCPNCRATIDTSTNNYHYSRNNGSSGGYHTAYSYSYGSSGGYSYGSSGGTATPTQVLPVVRPVQKLFNPLRSVLRRNTVTPYSVEVVETTQVPLAAATPKASAKCCDKCTGKTGCDCGCESCCCNDRLDLALKVLQEDIKLRRELLQKTTELEARAKRLEGKGDPQPLNPDRPPGYK